MPAHDADALIKKGWDAIRSQDLAAAEELFSEAVTDAPSDPDGWNGLGAVHFERAELEASLRCYERARDEAMKRFDGELPERLPWSDETNKPLLRALHGVGMNRFRMGDAEAAKAEFERLLSLNPSDEQGARYILDDIEKRRRLWTKGAS